MVIPSQLQQPSQHLERLCPYLCRLFSSLASLSLPPKHCLLPLRVLSQQRIAPLPVSCSLQKCLLRTAHFWQPIPRASCTTFSALCSPWGLGFLGSRRSPLGQQRVPMRSCPAEFRLCPWEESLHCPAIPGLPSPPPQTQPFFSPASSWENKTSSGF